MKGKPKKAKQSQENNMSIFFADCTMNEIEQAQKNNALIILPVGILEEHAAHLPISTDNIIAEQVSIQLAKRIEQNIPVKVLPTIWAGYHGNVIAKFPGSIRVKPETLMNFIFDILESLCTHGFKKIMIINGHGQNPPILELACRKITDKYNVIPILTFPMGMIGNKGREIRTTPQGGAGGHADEIETALILTLQEELVHMELAPDDTCNYRSKFVPGDTFPEHEVLGGVYWSTWHIQKTKSGAIGNAKTATVETGQKLMDVILQNYEDLAQEYYNFESSIDE